MAQQLFENSYYSPVEDYVVNVTANANAYNTAAVAAVKENDSPAMENMQKDSQQRNATAEMIDCTTFTLDSGERKFITVGLDPASDFNVTVRLSNSTRDVRISSEFTRRLYSMLGHILSIITDSPTLRGRGERLFLKDETSTLSKTMYRGKNMLLVDSHRSNGSRGVMLSRSNLLKMQDLKRCVEETITRKLFVSRATVCELMDQTVLYLSRNIYRASGTSCTETAALIRNIHNDLIAMHVPCSLHDRGFLEQIKLFAVDQLAQRWIAAKRSAADDGGFCYVTDGDENKGDGNNNNNNAITENDITYPLSEVINLIAFFHHDYVIFMVFIFYFFLIFYSSSSP